MKRRDFIKIGAVGGAASLVNACGAEEQNQGVQLSSKKFTWSLAMIVGKQLPIWAESIQSFADQVELLSNGRMRIKVYGAGDLVPALGVFDAVKKGTIEMGHSAAYYWRGKVPGSEFFTAVPFGMTTNGMNSWIKSGGGQALWDELYASHNLKAFPCGSTGRQMGGWFQKEINTPDDFKGLKIRMPGLGGEVLSRLGASPMNIPGDEIFTSLSTKVIDATEWIGPYHDYLMGFYKVAPHYYAGGWHEPGSILELLINKERWEELPKDLQGIIETCAAQTNALMHSKWLHMDSVYFEKIRSEGSVKLHSYNKDLIEKIKSVSEQVMNELAAKDSLTRKIHNSFTDFQKNYESYTNYAEQSFGFS